MNQNTAAVSHFNSNASWKRPLKKGWGCWSEEREAASKKYTSAVQCITPAPPSISCYCTSLIETLAERFFFFFFEKINFVIYFFIFFSCWTRKLCIQLLKRDFLLIIYCRGTLPRNSLINGSKSGAKSKTNLKSSSLLLVNELKQSYMAPVTRFNIWNWAKFEHFEDNWLHINDFFKIMLEISLMRRVQLLGIFCELFLLEYLIKNWILKSF